MADTLSDTYDPDLETRLLLPSSASASWGAAVHEAGNLLAGAQPRSWDLCTLALTLFALTRTGRAPREVPVTELHSVLSGPDHREPQIVDEIDQALTATGQSGTPLWDIFNAARDRYGSRGGGWLGDDVEPPAPGPSPMRAAAARLALLFADYPEQGRQHAGVPEITAVPLVIESDRIQIVQAGSVKPLSCPQGCQVREVRVDGPEAVRVCTEGHESKSWELDAARVRLAVIRATGPRPAVQGRHQLQELLIASTTLPRQSDPRQANRFLRPQPPLVGRDDILARLDRLVDGR